MHFGLEWDRRQIGDLATVNKDCSYLQSKISFEQARIKAKLCFPMFDFYLAGREMFEGTVFSLQSELNDVYVKNRQFLHNQLHGSLPIEEKAEPYQCPEKTVKVQLVDKGTGIQEEFLDYIVFKELVQPKIEPSKNVFNDENLNHRVEDEVDFINMSFENQECLEEEIDLTIAGCSTDTDLCQSVRVKHAKSEMTQEELESQLELFYQSNKHPTFEEMNTLRDLVCKYSSFRSIFNFFEKKRQTEGEVCFQDDTCSISRNYIEMERKPIGSVVETIRMTNRMNKIFEDHWCSRRVFHNGYSYAMSEVLGLPPKYIRYRYKQFLKRVSIRKSNRTAEAKMETEPALNDLNPETPRSCHHQTNWEDLTPEVVQILEKTYQTRKEEYSRNRWSKSIVDSLSIWCGISSSLVRDWIRNRDNAAKALSMPHKFKDWQMSVMMSFFTRNSHPEQEEFTKLANTFKVDEESVKQWFLHKQNMIRTVEKTPKRKRQSIKR